jgi:hypothetical protein
MADERFTSFVLGVGGITLRFETDEPGLSLAITSKHRQFLTEALDEPSSVIRVRLGDPAPSDVPLSFSSGGVWDLRKLPGGEDEVLFYTVEHTAVVERVPMRRLTLSPSLDRGTLVVDPRYAGGGTVRIGYPVDEHVASRLIARRGACVLHASAVVPSVEAGEEEGAMVFMGHSGAGKSTIAGLAQGAGYLVLSDDRTVIASDGQTARAWGTPWHGTLPSGSPRRVPIRGIFLLEQAPEDSAELVEQSRAFAEMMTRVIRPTIDPLEQHNIISAVESVAMSVPVGVLRFRPTVAALELARQFVSY